MKNRLSPLALAVGLMVAPAARGAGGFGAPVVVTGLDLGEPGIDVASDGTIYVNAPPGLNVSGSPSLVFRSDDGGATWALTPPGGLVYSQSTVAATPADQTGCVCPPGTLIAEPGTASLGSGDRVGLVYFTSTGGINFARSLDGAVTFTNVPVSPPSSADTTHAFPVVASAGNDTLHAVWLEVFGTASSRVRYARSSNWGASWTKPATLVGSGTSV